jgi:hypothetical protein
VAAAFQGVLTKFHCLVDFLRTEGLFRQRKFFLLWSIACRCVSGIRLFAGPCVAAWCGRRWAFPSAVKHLLDGCLQFFRRSWAISYVDIFYQIAGADNHRMRNTGNAKLLAHAARSVERYEGSQFFFGQKGTDLIG